MPLILKILLRPRTSLGDVLESSARYTLLYCLLLASLGSILSFISLYFLEGEELARVLTYSVVIYILDLLSVLIFGFYLSKTEGLGLERALKLSVFATTPVWVSDVVDLYQPLRPLSTLGLLYSLYIIFIWLNELRVKRKALHLLTYTALYLLNAAASEAIFQNPLVKKILNTSLRSVLAFLQPSY